MNANDLFKAVTELDLEPIKMKLMHVQSGEGWSLEKANAVEKEYRRFLCLMKLFPEEDTSPLMDVDTFWHYHILDTMKYATDCDKVFGYFLHHYPYVGMDGTEEDEQFRLDSGDRMRELYEATFGEAYPVDQAEDFRAAAYCASPHIDFAYCASPHVARIAAQAEGAISANSAYCASPHVANIAARSKNSATAYCASPHVANTAARSKGSATAYCASPHVANTAARSKNSATAYCASPHVASIAARSKNSATAYCASPHVASIAARSKGSATAYCASPHVARTQVTMDA